MATKLFIFLGLVALSQAGILAPAYYSAPAPAHGWQQPAQAWQQPAQAWQQPTVVVKKVVAAEAPANYDFNYDVNDHHTGDVHSQQERAENGAIKGSYQLNDADGFRRIVDYTADDVHGFQANVRREPLGHQQVIVKKIIAQPAIAVQKIIAPAHGWQQPSQGWQAAPSHGWQAAPAHGWQ